MFGKKEPEEAPESQKQSQKGAPKQETQKPPEPKHQETGKVPAPQNPPTESPPLFVKIDRYNDILSNMKELQSHAKGLEKTLNKLDNIEEKLHRSISASYRTLDGLSTIIAMLINKLSKKGKEKPSSPQSKRESKEIEKYFDDVGQEMEKIKKELEGIS